MRPRLHGTTGGIETKKCTPLEEIKLCIASCKYKDRMVVRTASNVFNQLPKDENGKVFVDGMEVIEKPEYPDNASHLEFRLDTAHG
jgi:hypothetical protein